MSFFSDNALYLLAKALAFFLVIPFHETAHAWASYKLGDPTAKDMGRLSLNPIKHFDLMGFIAMLVIGIGWAKPVPINPSYYKNPKKGMALVAAAGPLSNLLLGYVFMVIFKVMYYTLYPSIATAPSGDTSALVLWGLIQIMSYLAIINIGLAVFNLLPIPPFDGSRIVSIFLPDKQYFAIQKYERFIMIGVIILVYLGVLNGVLSTMQEAAYNMLNFLTGYIDLIFA